MEALTHPGRTRKGLVERVDEFVDDDDDDRRISHRFQGRPSTTTSRHPSARRCWHGGVSQDSEFGVGVVCSLSGSQVFGTGSDRTRSH